jgi:cobaltochelatase CobS
LGAELAAKVDARLQALDVQIREIVESVKIRAVPATISVFTSAQSDTPTAVLNSAHYQTATLIRLVNLCIPVMLVGPAGSGKTHASEQCAEALGLRFFPMSVGPQTSKTDLLGYTDAHSNVVRTPFREAFENGGLFLLDEIDAGNPAVLTTLNSALANGHCSFPGAVEPVKKHADFRVVAAANTFGNGASRQYVGRNQLDAATLDRFVAEAWNYDTTLEASIVGAAAPARLSLTPAKSTPCTADEWTAYVHALREAALNTGVRAIFSTRAIIYGCRMLAAGFDRETTEALVLWNKLSVDDGSKLREAL